MLKKNPKDKTLQNLVDKVRDRLQVAREKELAQVYSVIQFDRPCLP
jgi:hypothetical protein